MSLEDMHVKILKALAHPIRLKIVQTLLDGPLCVCVLNENIEFSQSNLSQHLKVLKDAGILKSEKEGLRIIYSVTDDEVGALLDVANRIAENQIKTLNDSLTVVLG